MSAFEPRVVSSDDPGVTVWDFMDGENHVRQLMGADQTAGRLSFFESVLAPGVVITAHIHREVDEYWYMLDGGIEVLLGGRQIPVAAGSIVAIPAGTLHELRNAADTSVRSIFFAIPGGLEDFFAGTSDLLASGAKPADFAALFERTGTVFPRNGTA